MAEEFDNKTENTSAQSNGGGREGYRSNDYQGGGYRSNGGRTMRPRIGGAQRAYSTNRSYDNNNDGGFRPEGFGAGLQHDNNGGGYPDGLKGEEIPIAAQVVSIADAYDALISPRVYKEGFSHEQAMQMIRNGECGAFNPLLIECLEDSQSRIRYLASMTAERFS